MRFDAKFYATSLCFDTSMDERMGRKLAGYHGKGWVELQADALLVHARRHNYLANLIGGVIGGALLMGVAVMIWLQKPEDGLNPMFGFFGAVLGAFLTSLLFRFTARKTETIPMSTIERTATVGGKYRVFRREGGDLQLTAAPEAWNALQHACYARGIPCT